MMKHISRYTTLLLRTTFLFGAMILINITGQAQDATQWAEMPDAFETMDPASIIGDGNYYYIQFYQDDHMKCSYLTDCGVNMIAKSKDFLPYAYNRLWTLESANDENATHFYLKNKAGHYISFGTFESKSRVGCVDNIESASVLTFHSLGGDGYDISRASDDGSAEGVYPMYRPSYVEWAELAYNSKKGSSSVFNVFRLRFAKLKSTAAFIIYYRGEHTDGNDNSSPNVSTTRHYLTYSGTDYGLTSLIDNGSLESGDASCFFSPNGSTSSTITDGIGTNSSRGISVWSSGSEANDYDTQFFIKAKSVIPIGKTVRIEFDYKAGTNVNGVQTQAHAAPGTYIYWDAIGSINFTTEWQHFEKEVTVTSDMGGSSDNFQTIAFNLGKKDATNFYFDNIVFTILEDTEVSSRRSIIPSDKPLCTLPTLAAYHQDGLWALEGTGSDGEFYIKKYGTEEYLNASKGSGVYLSSLGTKDDVFGKYKLEDLTVNRYTRIQNKKYTTTTLTSGNFYTWDGDGAGANSTGSASVENNVGNSVGAGATVIGSSSVLYLTYADLTGNTNMVIEGTPGMQLRALFNRQGSNDGPWTERNVTIGEDGKAILDLTDLSFIHLNAIKTGWGSPSGTITAISLVNQNSVDASDPRYLNYEDGDGWPVSQQTGADDDYWYAGFYPVEVPVPNKDNYFQVLVKYGDNMINHGGGVTSPCPTEVDDYDLWQLEQVDDYLHFRLKDTATGRYLKGVNQMTEPNDPTDAEINTNAKFYTDFSLTWFYVNPAAKEIVVDHMVTHKKSYLQQYAQAGLDKQGLATNADSDWWNYGKGTQKTNHFEITHYVKKGNTITVEFPTVLNRNNDHIYYQRFYDYDEADEENMDLANLKAHVSLDTRDDGNVQYFLYKNGMVTGQKLTWKNNDGTDISDGGYARNEQRRFNFTNSDGNAFTVAADVSRYSDLTYEYPDAPQTGDLEEPSLTMRYIYYMKDAKVMATSLSSYTEQAGVTDATTWNEEGTVCIDDSKWMETKEFHFPDTPLPYENNKWAGYRGEFIGLRHVFSDYWVFDGAGTGDDNLVSAVNDANGGKIEVRIYDPNNTGIRLGGWNPNIDLRGTTEGDDADYQGFYFYDKVARNQKTQYGDSRFIVFRYPEDGEGKATTVTVVENKEKKAYIHVYLNNNGTRYQLAQFTVIFDENSDTRPWTSVNGYAEVVDTDRDPNKLRERAGKPIAKITFDYPDDDGVTYHYPASTAEGPLTRHNGGDNQYGTIANSSPVPLRFDNTNYAFDGDGCNWGSYAMVTTKNTDWGNQKTALPANDATYGYGIGADTDLQSAFLYIDASEQPGDICSADFQGEFCAGDKLMCSGWISGSNRYDDDGEYRCPGGITLTVKGERIEDGQKETIYRFCPGQCYELDNGTGVDGSDGTAEKVVWQQFYFEFGTTQKYKRYWMEVNNNCVSSNGGDFMLDNVEVFALVPEVIPEMNTPVCVNKDVSEMQLLKLNIGFDKILAATKSTEVTGESAGLKKDISFVFLEKDKFLTTFLEELNKEPLNLGIANVEALEKKIEKGEYENLITTNANYKAAYKAAFDAAILGDINKVWDSNPESSNNANLTAAVLNYHWSTKFSEMETFSFAKAVNGLGSVFRETDTGSGERFIVINGNYPNKLKWKTDTEYYVIPFTGVVSLSDLYEDFNICSACCKKTEFHLDPSVQILSMEASDVTEDLVVCEGKIPTLLTNLKGYNINGESIPLTNLNFDWWLGNETTLATLDNYHSQKNATATVRLDEALYILRIYYPEVTSLDGVVPRSKTNTTQTTYHQGRNDPELTQEMIDYLKGLVDAGQLILHQKSISIPAEKASDEDPYFYLVACPIHDGYFEKALNPAANKYVAYFCDEPQGLRIKVGEKAPTLKCGFVPNENGFTSYDYSSVNDAVLSIRLAKKEQFEEVQHGETTDTPTTTYNTSASSEKHFLWLPIRNAEVVASTGVIRKSDDYDVYLASTDDPTWDQNIYTAMSQTIPKLPIVGKIVQLTAVNTKVNPSVDQTSNRLCIYFTSNFEVREGYNYTLSLPFKEDGDGNACDGTLLINLKIVPDYEVWTGAAGNTDWNNDQNWRRADGNTSPKWNANDELYVGAAGENSPLKGYKTNDWNYRTDNDRVLRKGFAPLYCTHVLIKSDEWGNAPVLYDALDGAGSLSASPFPNLRDTSTPILKFDLQARKYDIWTETYASTPDKGRTGDLLAEMYQVNSCDEIAFQPATELRNAHLLNYNNAWVEYQLDMKRWYLLGSPLQGTIAGEWYAPTGNAQQQTTYYDDVTFGEGYDRYSPAFFQRSWDKAKAVLYEVGSTYSTNDNPNDGETIPGSTQQGYWDDSGQTVVWNTTGADAYLARLGYKPMDGKKVNVAMKGIWSNTYNDATVDYTKGGFSVMVLNNLKSSGGGNDNPTIVRLPKEDTMYDYYRITETGADDGGTDTDLTDVQNTLNRAKNRGRLKTDLLLPESTQKQEKEASSYKYGDRRTYTRVPIKEADLTTMIAGIRSHQETASAGISNMGYYLVENPFPCGMNMDQFFTTNTGLEKKYWLLTATGQHLVQKAASGEWITQSSGNFTTANAVVAPGQGFFVQATTAGEATTITFNKDMQAQSRYGVKANTGIDYEIVVGTKQKMTTKEETVTLDDGSTQTVTIEVPEVDTDGNYVIEEIKENVTVYNYEQTSDENKQYSLRAAKQSDDEDAGIMGLVITAQRGDQRSSALVMQRKDANNDFLPSEDTEAFINSDLQNIPTVYTLCGRLATTINSIHDFRCLPLGVESASDASCTLTFRGVETLGDSIAIYDAVEQTLTPLESGAQMTVSGQTQNRYYIVKGLNLREAAEETHLQIFAKGKEITVIASTQEPISSVRCFDTAGRLVYSANPQTAEHRFSLQSAGIYIIDAQTDNDRKTQKVMTK